MLLNVVPSRGTRVQIDALIMDITVNEHHTFNSTVTQEPVEDGFFTSDHVQQETTKFNISGFWSDTPIYIPGSPAESNNLTGRGVFVFRKLLELGGYRVPINEDIQPVKVTEPKRITVRTDYYLYTSMIISRISVVKSKEKQGGLWANITFTRIDVTKNEFTTITTVEEVNGNAKGIKNNIQNKIKIGNTATKEVDTNTTKGTFATGLVDTIDNWLNPEILPGPTGAF